MKEIMRMIEKLVGLSYTGQLTLHYHRGSINTITIDKAVIIGDGEQRLDIVPVKGYDKKNGLQKM